MERIITLLNIIANYIVQNQGLIIEIQIREKISTGLNANQVTYQSNIIIHQFNSSSI